MARLTGSFDDERDRSTGGPSLHAGVVAGATKHSHVLDYLRVLSKRRYTAASTFLLVLVTVVAYTWTATPLYEARVQLMIETEHPRVVVFKDLINQDDGKLDYQQTQIAILQSRGLAKRTLDTLRLWTHPEFAADLTKPGLFGRVTGSISKSAPPPKNGGDAGPARNESAAEARALDAFIARLSVTPIRNSRIVDVKFRSTNPQLAAAIANALAEVYTKENLEYKSLASKEASDWLGSQLEEQRKRVDASEATLQRYREQTESVSPDARENTVMQKLNDLNAALMRAKTERIQKEALYMQVSALQKSGSNFDAVPAALANPFIQNLKSQLNDLQRQQAQLRPTLGAKHPDMIKLQESIDATQSRLEAETGKVVEALQHDYLATRAEENGLAQAVEGQKREALVMRRKQIGYDSLEHAAASDRQIFETLLQRTKETGVSGQSMATNIRVIDTAEVPLRPISPRKNWNLMLGVMGGLLFGLGAALFVDYLDKSIQTPEDVKTLLHLPCLGMVPTELGSDGALLLSRDVPPRFREAFRTVRTNVLFACKVEVRTILVTSTGPNEGKTVIATNLAISLAQTGQRVLLIDADMRRPSVHKAFGVPSQPGLAEVAAGHVQAIDVILDSSSIVPGLYILPAGGRPPNPAELLSSPRLKQLLSTLEEEFAWVVIDSPPVMAVTDASLLANVVGAVLFVVAADQTMGAVALNAIDQLDSADATFVGAVLNRVDVERNAFFYSSHYRQEYGQYYTGNA